jgi:poly(3-hydroxybutyrate) depolymerase
VVAPADAVYVPWRTPARARPILLAWGTADKLNPMSGGKVPYGGGVVLDKPAPIQTATNWAGQLGCRRGPVRSLVQDGVEQLVWSDCSGRTRVELYLANGLGHHWAGGEPVPFPDAVVGPYAAPFEMTQLMWDFFERSVP